MNTTNAVRVEFSFSENQSIHCYRFRFRSPNGVNYWHSLVWRRQSVLRYRVSSFISSCLFQINEINRFLRSAVGYNIGVINSPAEFMKKWCNETLHNRYGVEMTFDQLQTLWSAVISIFLIGGCAGSIIGAWVADRFGRKVSLLYCGVLFAIGAVLFYICRALASVEILVIGRLVVGLASGLTTSILPMYLAEVAPLELRGTLAVLTGLGSLLKRHFWFFVLFWCVPSCVTNDFLVFLF